MPQHAFVDESFEGGYVMAVATAADGHVTARRATVRRLFRHGQSRIHFKKENDARRKQILACIGAPDLPVRVYVTENGLGARRACRERIVPDVVELGVTRLVLERDDAVVEADRRTLFELTGKHADLAYRHLRASEDPLLCVADAVAWCYAKGGRGRLRIAAFTTVIRAWTARSPAHRPSGRLRGSLPQATALASASLPSRADPASRRRRRRRGPGCR